MPHDQELQATGGCLTRLLAQWESEAVVDGVVRIVLDQASEVVRDAALAELELSVGATAVTAKLVPLLKWEKLHCDQPDEQWFPPGCNHPEQEPNPPSIDSWARGVITLNQPPCTPQRRPSSRSHDAETSVEEVGDKCRMTSLSPEQEPQQRRSGTTGVDEKLLVRDQDSISVIPNSPTKTIQCPGRGHDTGSGDGRAWGGGKEEDEGQDMGLTVLPVCEDVNIAAALGMGAFGNGRRQEERMFLEGLRIREENQAREKEHMRAKLEKEKKDAIERAERLKRELKGKDWVWGTDGEVLLLDVIPPEKMPARVVPRVGIRSAPVNDTCAPVSTSIATCEEQTATNGSTSGPIDINSPPTAPSVASSPKRGRLNEVTSTKGMKAGHNSSVSGREEGRGSGGRGSVDDGSGGCSGGPMTRSRKKRSRVKSKSEQFFEVSATSQPRLVDSLDVQAGVCVRQGDTVKEGPAFEESQPHMPRRGFLESTRMHAAAPPSVAQENLPLNQEPVGAEQEPRVGVPSIVSPPTTNPPRSNSLEVGNDRNTANDGRSHEHASRKSRGRSLTSEHVRTLDPLSGAVRVEKSSRRAEDPDDDPHWRLYKQGGNINGGMSPGGVDGGGGGNAGEGRGLRPVPPPPIPRKSRSRRRRGELLSTSRQRRPRDRSSRLVVSTGARKHLPPPPYGETMGHGLTPPRERDAASAMAATTPIVPCPGTSAAGGGGAVARAGRAPIDGGGTSKIDNAIVDSPGIRQRYREPLSGALAGGMNTAIPAMTTGSRSPSPIKNNFARSAGGGLDALESFSISTRERGREARGYGGVGGRRRTHRLRSASLTSPATSRAAREEEGVGGQSRGRQDIGGVKGKGKGNHRDIDRGIGGGKEFPALPANALSPVRGRHGYRCPAAEGGWIRMRQSQGTLEQLLRTT